MRKRKSISFCVGVDEFIFERIKRRGRIQNTYSTENNHFIWLHRFASLLRCVCYAKRVFCLKLFIISLRVNWNKEIQRRKLLFGWLNECSKPTFCVSATNTKPKKTYRFYGPRRLYLFCGLRMNYFSLLLCFFLILRGACACACVSAWWWWWEGNRRNVFHQH